MSKTISSLQAFVREVLKHRPNTDEHLVYRGHSKRDEYKLLPHVLREKRFVDAEPSILRQLIALHPEEFAQDRSTLDQLVRVQHYSLPTRLLDATSNPLVALYFATTKHKRTAGEVIVFRIKKEHVRFFDSDTVSCLANLAHLKRTEKEEVGFSLSRTKFNKRKSVDRLLQFIRVEKPHFRPVIRPRDLKRVVCVTGQNAKRVVQHDQFCAEHRHIVRNLQSLNDRLKSPDRENLGHLTRRHTALR